MNTKRKEAKKIQFELDQFNQQIRSMEKKANQTETGKHEKYKENLARLTIKRDRALKKLTILLKEKRLSETFKERFENICQSLNHAYLNAKDKLFPTKHSRLK